MPDLADKYVPVRPWRCFFRRHKWRTVKSRVPMRECVRCGAVR